MKFTVYRDEWLRGNSNGSLYRDGKRCCLGFLGNAVGLTDKVMDGWSKPSTLSNAPWPKSLLRSIGDPAGEFMIDSALCVRIVSANDGKHLTDPEREAILTKLFADGGIEIVFEDTRA